MDQKKGNLKLIASHVTNICHLVLQAITVPVINIYYLKYK